MDIKLDKYFWRYVFRYPSPTDYSR